MCGWLVFLGRLNRLLERCVLAALRFEPRHIKPQVNLLESLHVIGWNM